MPRLSVPEVYAPGIAHIGRIPDSDFRQFYDALLADAPQVNDTQELTRRISEKVSSLNGSAIAAMAMALSAMTRAQSRGALDKHAFAVAVWNGLQQESPSVLEGVDHDTVVDRITRLLENVDLDLPRVKTEDLKLEVERNYCDARILTDLRAGFHKNVDDDISMMVVLHNLRISFHDDEGHHREFYVAMDGKDLVDLKAQVDRAQRKSAALIEKMRIANIEVVE